MDCRCTGADIQQAWMCVSWETEINRALEGAQHKSVGSERKREKKRQKIRVNMKQPGHTVNKTIEAAKKNSEHDWAGEAGLQNSREQGRQTRSLLYASPADSKGGCSHIHKPHPFGGPLYSIDSGHALF